MLLSAYKCIIYENSIWFADTKTGWICSTNMSHISKVVTPVVCLHLCSGYLFYEILRSDKYIVLVPWDADRIVVYDLINNRTSYIVISKYDKRIVMRTGFIKNGYLYAFGCNVPKLLVVNLKNSECEVSDFAFYKEIPSNYVWRNNFYFMSSVIMERDVWLCCGCTDYIIKWSMDESIIESYRVPLDIKCFYGILVKDKVIWLIGSKSNQSYLIKYCIDTGECTKEKIPYEKESLSSLREINWIGNKILIIPENQGQVFIADSDTLEIELLADFSHIASEKKIYGYSIDNERKLITIIAGDMNWYVYDVTGEILDKYENVIDENSDQIKTMLKIERNKFINEGKEILQENKGFSVLDLVNAL